MFRQSHSTTGNNKRENGVTVLRDKGWERVACEQKKVINHESPGQSSQGMGHICFTFNDPYTLLKKP
jgi:hypothetical protein